MASDSYHTPAKPHPSPLPLKAPTCPAVKYKLLYTSCHFPYNYTHSHTHTCANTHTHTPKALWGQQLHIQSDLAKIKRTLVQSYCISTCTKTFFFCSSPKPLLEQRLAERKRPHHSLHMQIDIAVSPG